MERANEELRQEKKSIKQNLEKQIRMLQKRLSHYERAEIEISYSDRHSDHSYTGSQPSGYREPKTVATPESAQYGQKYQTNNLKIHRSIYDRLSSTPETKIPSQKSERWSDYSGFKKEFDRNNRNYLY